MQIQTCLAIVCLAVAYQCATIDAQYSEGSANIPAGGQAETPGRRVQNVNVPLFYDMVKSGSSLGINVLQGLVKVERGEEAERNGLVGARPLSVRIFGIPVYERGVRVRPASGSQGPVFGPAGPGGPISGGEEEELPIEPTANLKKAY